MNPNSDKSGAARQPERGGDSPREQAARADEGSNRAKATPAADMQADDAGTDASAPESTAPDTPAQSVMKQQSKTDAERR